MVSTVSPADPSASLFETLWYTRCPVPTASSVARHLDIFKTHFSPHGIEVKSLRAEAEAAKRESHFHHQLDSLVREGGNIPGLWAQSRSQDTVLIALTWINEFQAILTHPSTGIREVADLKHRRVAIPKHSVKTIDFAQAMALRGIYNALSLAGLSDQDVTFVPVTAATNSDLREGTGAERLFDPQIAALLAHEVEAIYVKGSTGIDLAARYGLTVVVDLGSHPDVAVRINNGTPRTITVNRALAQDHPQIVADFLGCLLRAAEWAKTHPEEVIDIVAQETNTSPEAVHQAYGSDLHHHLHPQLSPTLLEVLDDQNQFLYRQGFLEQPVDIATWVDPYPLQLAHSQLGQP